MKYDINHLTKGKKRNLKIMFETLAGMLEKESFEEIQVSRFCEECMVPKATFYNYFEDKYDLLDYLFETVRFYILGSYDREIMYDRLEAARICFEGMSRYRSRLEKIVQRNPVGSEFYWRLTNYMTVLFEKMYQKFPTSFRNPDLDNSFLARIESGIMLMVFYWTIEKHLTIEEMIMYMEETSLGQRGR